MATSGKSSGKNLVVKLDTQAGVLKTISAYVKSVDGLPGDMEMGDVTVGGGATGYAYFPIFGKAEFSLTCVFDDTSDSAWDVAKSYLSDTATRSFEVGPAGSTSGYVKLTGECRIKKVGLPVKVNEVLIFTIDCVVDGAVTIGTYT
jgi:hypothetical protein